MSWEKLKIENIILKGIHFDLLKQQGQGLTKVIGTVFQDLSEKSAWLDGTGEAWERGPYYMDGLIPLAFLLRDKELITKAKLWANSVLKSQTASGFFGPRQNNDWWPRSVVLKAMVSYSLASKEKQVLPFIKRYLHFVLNNIDNHPFEFWGFARGLEGKEAIDLLEETSSNDWVVELESKMLENTLDWNQFFSQFPYMQPTTRYLNRFFFNIIKPFLTFFDSLVKRRKRPTKINKAKILKSRDSKLKYIYLTTHGVNIAMALKYLIYVNESSKNDASDMFKALENVLQYHGNALDLFSSDEHLNGLSPKGGIELCTVVEMMYSMEEAIRLTGSHRAADYLEYYAYNALLATISNDFTSHQYVQQVNQIDCEIRRHSFYDANKFANTFGIEPNFGCCAANMHQGWPKMMLSAVLKSKDTLGIFLYISGIYKVNFEDGQIFFEITTNYPFSDEVVIKCIKSTVTNPKIWMLRIPYSTRMMMTYKGNSSSFEMLDSLELNDVESGSEIILKFDFSVQTLINPDGSISVRKGSILYSLPIESSEFYIKGKRPFHDRGYHPKKIPEVVPILKNGKVIVKSFKQTIDEQVFFNNQSILTIQGYNLKNNNYQDMNMVPYGMTILRKTQFARRNSDEK